LQSFIEALKDHDPIIRFVSYIVSPILAIIAFIFNRRSQQQMLDLRDEATRQEKDAEFERHAANEAQAKAIEADGKLKLRQAEINRLEDDITKLTKGSETVWKIRDNRPFPNYHEWRPDPKGTKFITFGNLKGGVGKTTLAINFAAYVSETLGKRVLLVDLDFQGSMTQTVLLAANNSEVQSKVQNLFGSNVSLPTFETSIVHLNQLMSRCTLVPSGYEFNERENQMLWEAVQRDSSDIDIRYRLAHTLYRPEVQKQFDVVIFDMPPRMSLGTVNALVASHWLVVPTIIDKLSTEAVTRFLSQMLALKNDLELDLKLAAVVGMMHRIYKLNENEQHILQNVSDELDEWLPNGFGITNSTIPRKQAIAKLAGEQIPYLASGPDYEKLRNQHFDPLFGEISQRIGLL
ncbi:MAG: ParA family protein, partial [Pseudomonadota bacterium]